jgi:hypothetical protein
MWRVDRAVSKSAPICHRRTALSTEIAANRTTRVRGRAPLVTPELRAAHRVGAPVCHRGRVHHRPYDAAHNWRQRSIGIDELAIYSHPRLKFSILNEFHSLKMNLANPELNFFQDRAHFSARKPFRLVPSEQTKHRLLTKKFLL